MRSYNNETLVGCIAVSGCAAIALTMACLGGMVVFLIIKILWNLAFHIT